MDPLIVLTHYTLAQMSLQTETLKSCYILLLGVTKLFNVYLEAMAIKIAFKKYLKIASSFVNFSNGLGWMRQAIC